jgi:hypothetical protein
MATVNVTQNAFSVVVVDESNVVVQAGEAPAAIVQTVGLGPQGPGGVLGIFANIIDTTDQPIVSTSAAQAITFNTLLESRGVSVASSSRITFELAGTYKILASLQVTNSSNNMAEVNFYCKKNSATIANTNTRIDLQPRKSASSPYHDCFTIEYQFSLLANDYIEFFWAASSLGITLDTIPPDAIHPQAPSAIVNVAQVMYAQEDNGNLPSGGTTGQILSKASSSNYDAVWVDPPASSFVVDDAAKVDKSLVYYDAATASFKADQTVTTTTIVDGANF